MKVVTEDFIFLEKWRAAQASILRQINPDVSERDINAFLDKQIQIHLKNPVAEIHNNYVDKAISDSLLGIINWMENTKPIIGGYGVFYKQHKDSANPILTMLLNFIKMRKFYKDKLKVLPQGSHEYTMADLQQGHEKMNTNSWYGGQGAKSFIFYNLYTAASITSTGQSLISTTQQAFEAFMSNNVPFLDLDDCFHFLENIRSEKRKFNSDFLPYISVERLLERLKKNFLDYDPEYEPLLYAYLLNQSHDTLKRMFFKNNMYNFFFTREMNQKVRQVFQKCNSFKDPNEVPKEVEEEMADLWAYVKEFVFYNYPAFDRIKRLKTLKRKTVIIVDTDSNFLNLNKWVKFIHHTVINPLPEVNRRSSIENRFISVNVMCFFITKMITDVLTKYTATSNIDPAFGKYINMKNEFYLSRIAVASTKKRHASIAWLKEGRFLNPGVIDIKGFDFKKSSASKDTKQMFTDIIEKEILLSETIDVGKVLRIIYQFERDIKQSIHDGERKYLTPVSVRQLSAYNAKRVYSMQGVRAALVWNALHPHNEINLPDKYEIIKLKTGNRAMLEEFAKEEPERFKLIEKKILNHREKSVQKFDIIALPRNIQEIPKWILKWIDFDKISEDNIKKFHPILESLGVAIISNSKMNYATNIMKV